MIHLRSSSRIGGKTTQMLVAALQEADKGINVGVICANTREVFRLKRMAKDLCFPLSVPKTISFYSKHSQLVETEFWPFRIIGLPFGHKVFINNFFWESR